MININKALILIGFLVVAALSSAETFAAGIFNPRDFGGKGDGKTKDTAAIQSAIDAASNAGGGGVIIDSGTWLSGTIYLKDNTALEIRSGATLMGSPDKEDYNADDFCPQNVILGDENVSGAHLIVALNVKNVTLCGGGTIDGNGMAFWMSEPENKDVKIGERFKFPKWRPAQMLFFCESSNIRVKDLSILNPTYWSDIFFGCENVIISNLFIKNDHRGHNNDGIDIDASSNVVISDCIIDTEDDCIAIRCQGERLSSKRNVCENITISNCILSTRRCNAFRIGVGSGIIRNCAVNNVIVNDTRTGLCFLNTYKRRDGVAIENFKFSNLIINAANPIAMYTDNSSWGKGEGASHIRGISFSNCSFKGARTSVIGADTNKNISDISFSDCGFLTEGGDLVSDIDDFTKLTEWGVKSSPHAFIVQNARDIRFSNCKMRWGNITKQWKKSIVFRDCENVIAPSIADAPNCPELGK